MNSTILTDLHITVNDLVVASQLRTSLNLVDCLLIHICDLRQDSHVVWSRFWGERAVSAVAGAVHLVCKPGLRLLSFLAGRGEDQAGRLEELDIAIFDCLAQLSVGLQSLDLLKSN